MPNAAGGNPPNQNGGAEGPAKGDPIPAAFALGEFIRGEHGREGVRMYVQALSGLLPEEHLLQLSQKLNTAPPKPRPIQKERDVEPKRSGGMSPEQVLKLMQAMKKTESGKGIDPSILMSFMKK